MRNHIELKIVYIKTLYKMTSMTKVNPTPIFLLFGKHKIWKILKYPIIFERSVDYSK